jgi:hypothetical protein
VVVKIVVELVVIVWLPWPPFPPPFPPLPPVVLCDGLLVTEPVSEPVCELLCEPVDVTLDEAEEKDSVEEVELVQLEVLLLPEMLPAELLVVLLILEHPYFGISLSPVIPLLADLRWESVTTRYLPRDRR